MLQIIDTHLGLIQLVLHLSQRQALLVLCITEFLGQLLILEREITYLGQLRSIACLELFLKQLKARLRLTFIVRHLAVFVECLDHLSVLPLTLL